METVLSHETQKRSTQHAYIIVHSKDKSMHFRRLNDRLYELLLSFLRLHSLLL